LFRKNKSVDDDDFWDISAAELRYIMLTQEGLKITSEELDEIFRDADILENGKINYEDFVRMLVS
jgi:calmodulin